MILSHNPFLKLASISSLASDVELFPELHLFSLNCKIDLYTFNAVYEPNQLCVFRKVKTKSKSFLFASSLLFFRKNKVLTLPNFREFFLKIFFKFFLSFVNCLQQVETYILIT